MTDTDPIDLAARLNVEGHIRTRSAREFWQADRAADRCNHFPGQTECDWCRPTPRAQLERSGIAVFPPIDDVPATADPSPAFDDLEIPPILQRT